MTAMLAAQTDELEIATFYVDNAWMGVFIDQVEEINHHMDLTPVPNVRSSVRGLMNLRGEVVTVIDLRVVLGLEPAVIQRKTCNVVVRSGNERIGILADRVGDVILARRESIEPPPANVASADGRLLRGVCQLESDILAILDVEQILSSDLCSG